MSASSLDPAALAALASNPSHVRNICVLAHVDHGKTSLTDSLVAANGIISSKLAGRVRYLDSTEEEQARGITMKSSAIALLHRDEPFRELRRVGVVGTAGAGASADTGPPLSSKVQYLVNVIDSPGHVDFSADVSTAARLCDGAIVVVDAVEGVCIQTHAVLRTAWAEGVRPFLLINKVDRLACELQLTPSEAVGALQRIIESANAIQSSLYTSDVMGRMSDDVAGGNAGVDGDAGAGGGFVVGTDAWALDIDEGTEARLLFAPERGNVVFASAMDGWAFTLDDFAALHAPKLAPHGVSRGALRSALWGQSYWLPKSKAIARGGIDAAVTEWGVEKSMAVTHVFSNLWAVYDALLLHPNAERAAKIVDALGLGSTVSKRELGVKDDRARLQSVMRAWLPLHAAVLGTVVRYLPSPVEAQAKRLDRLWPHEPAEGGGCATQKVVHGGAPIRPPLAPLWKGMPLAARRKRIRAAIAACDPSPDADCVVFVSKMFAVPKASLPDAPSASIALPPPPASAWWGCEAAAAADLRAINSSDALRRLAAAAAAAPPPAGGDDGGADGPTAAAAAVVASAPLQSASDAAAATDAAADLSPSETFVAFARVFSGVLRPDAPLFVLGPRYSPAAPAADGSAHVSLLSTPSPLYLMMGRDLAPLPVAYAGQVVGIGRLGAHVLKTATLCSTPACPSLSSISVASTPLVRVAVEPLHTRDRDAVERGLALLNQADPCVDVTFLDSGEMQLAALGELHLQRCTRDLETRFARCPVTVSAPIISFQETLVASAPQLLGTGAPPPVPLLDDESTASGSVERVDEGGGGGGDIAAAPSAFTTALPPPLPASWGGGSGGAAAVALAAAATHVHSVHSRGGGLPYSACWTAPSHCSWGDGAAGIAAVAPLAAASSASDGAVPTTSSPTSPLAAVAAALPLASACWVPPTAPGAYFHPPSGAAYATSGDRSFTLRVRAAPLPAGVVALLSALEHAPALAALAAAGAATAAATSTDSAASLSGGSPAAASLAARLAGAFADAGPRWAAAAPHLWAVGPKAQGGCCMLLAPPDAFRALAGAGGGLPAPLRSVWAAAGIEFPPAGTGLAARVGTVSDVTPAASPVETPSPALLAAALRLRSSLTAGFRLFTSAGPLAGEPVWGVGFIVEEIVLRTTAAVPPLAAATVGDGNSDTACCGSAAAAAAALPPGPLMAASRDACRVAFSSGSARLVEALLRCELHCSGGKGGGGEAMGKCYAVLAKRRGRVLDEALLEGTATFVITALLPVVESFGFADDLRKKTSGAATSPQLAFSHWEALEADPFFAPTTADERAALGEQVHEGQGKNLARDYVHAVRKRRGLATDHKLVVHADKQRTLARKR